MKQRAVLGIDLGGTKVSGAIFDSSKELVGQEIALIGDRAGKDVFYLMLEVIEQLLNMAEKQLLEVKAIGVAVPGISYRNGTVWAPNIEGWDAFPLFSQLHAHLNDSIIIKIDSDRACYILGETWKGAAAGCKNAIFLAVGTGIGAGILVNGAILRGHSDIAGAIGWMALTENFIEPYKTQGCFEYHASGNGLASVATKAYRQSGGQKVDPVTAAEVFEASAKGDPIAKQVVENAISFWGKAAANLTSLFNPEKIIFGGGVFGPASEFIDEIYLEAVKWAQPISIKQVQFLASALSGRAGLYGAAGLVRDHLSHSND